MTCAFGLAVAAAGFSAAPPATTGPSCDSANVRCLVGSGVMRESALDRGTPWVASLRAHRSYWGSKDVMLFVLTRLIYGGGEAAAGVAAAAAPEPAAAPNGPVGVYDV